MPAATTTGWKGIAKVSGSSRPFQAKIRQGGKQHNLGYYATAAEAALAYARFLGPEGCATAFAAAAAAAEPPMT